jgi:hypothetical protein
MNPLWSTVDELAEYLEMAFETVRVMREEDPARMHAVADKDVSTNTSFLIVFTAICALMCVARPGTCGWSL